MCIDGDLPQELASKLKPLVFLYSIFFVLSAPYGFFAYVLPVLWEEKVQDVYFPVVFLYYITECCILFRYKRYNICTTIIFRSLIGVYDCISLIFGIIYLVKSFQPLPLYFWPIFIGPPLFHLFILITNCSLLFIYARFPQKGPWFSCDYFE